MGKKFKEKEALMIRKAKVVADANVRQRCKEEEMSNKEKLELYETIYNETLERLKKEAAKH